MPRCVGCLLLMAAMWPPLNLSAADSPSSQSRVLVRVEGRPITEADLQLLMTVRQVPEDQRSGRREELLQELIDRELIRTFLQGRKVEVSPELLDAQVRRVLDMLRRDGGDPQEILDRLGLTEQELREQIALPLTWEKYVRQITTPQRVREFFEQHQPQFDGTRVRVSQIFLKVPEGADARAATEKLAALRQQIEAGKLTFAEAARAESQSPSGQEGGDVGYVTYGGGRLPATLAEAAFSLKEGEISPPVRTPFGVHLLTVTDRKPGDLSLEDARPAVMTRLSRLRWDETIAQRRKTARIERPTGTGP